MNWLLVLLILIAAYGVLAAVIWKKQIWADHIVFFGPIMAIKSMKVGGFDWFKRFSTFLRLYASLGVVMVVIISIAMTLLLFLSLQYTFAVRPPPSGIYAPQNILLIPGLNEYIPSTIAVWLAFVITIAIHEFGHGILSRIENIRVKSVGALLFVVPIGFFVEPDEEDLNQTKGMKKVRMFGAGITNNIVAGGVCFLVMVLLMGLVVPVTGPIIGGVYQNYSASEAGILPYSIIQSVNGSMVQTPTEVSALLNATHPGDTLALSVIYNGVLMNYSLTLSEWPEGVDGRESGFMGITYYDSPLILQAIGDSISPIGFLRFLTVPFDMTGMGNPLRILAFETPAQQFYTVPFAGFWGIISFLFWCGWINISVGIFNAIPMVPLDGGYILKEGVERAFERRGLAKYAAYVTSFISTLMVVILISLIMLPYLFTVTAI